MTTLTITDAKKSLTKWLKVAASRGEVAIVCRADFAALRKVPVQATDYAWTEYGVGPDKLAAYTRRVDAEHRQANKRGKVAVVRNRRELETLVEKVARRPA